MYVSKPDQFLFIKSNKTAGTSIEIALSVCLANRDNQFYTPLTFVDEITRINLSGLSFSQEVKTILSCRKRNSFHKTLKKKLIRKRDKLSLLFGGNLSNLSSLRQTHDLNAESFEVNTGYYNHISYERCLLMDPALAEYWSCTFARHPYKRFISFLGWRTRHILQDTYEWNIDDWKNFAGSMIDVFCKRNIYHFSVDRKKCKSVSKVLAYEKLKDSTNIMCEVLGLPAESILNVMPNSKAGYSSIIKKISPDDILGKEIRSKLLKKEEFIFEGLGYKDSLENFMPDRTSFSM